MSGSTYGSANVCALPLMAQPKVVSDLAKIVGSMSVAGLQEIKVPRYKQAVRDTGYASVYLKETGQPIIWDPKQYQAVKSEKVRVHKGVAHITESRFATAVLLREHTTGALHWHVNTHMVAKAFSSGTVSQRALRQRMWNDGIKIVRALVTKCAADGHPVVVTGDYNRMNFPVLGTSIAGRPVHYLTGDHTKPKTRAKRIYSTGIDYVCVVDGAADRLDINRTTWGVGVGRNSDHARRWATVMYTNTPAAPKPAPVPKPTPKPAPKPTPAPKPETTMSNAQLYPAANHASQWYAKRYVGSKMNANCIVLHTTEGYSWPGYSNGAVAPTLTVMPDIANKRVLWRQHFPIDMSARALVNKAGGVETNTANAIQIEMVGTCDPSHRKSWGSKKAGRDYIYWPDAPIWLLKEIGKFLAWAHREHGIALQGPPNSHWGAYPGSYGSKAGNRFTNAQWRAFYGICGHQHVPENVHGDPGNINFEAMIAYAKGTPAPAPAPAPVSKPAPAPAPVPVPKPAPAPATPTNLSNARALLADGLVYANTHNLTGRAAKIQQALDILPER